jgi:hypothetical protein
VQAAQNFDEVSFVAQVKVGGGFVEKEQAGNVLTPAPSQWERNEGEGKRLTSCSSDSSLQQSNVIKYIKFDLAMKLAQTVFVD